MRSSYHEKIDIKIKKCKGPRLENCEWRCVGFRLKFLKIKENNTKTTTGTGVNIFIAVVIVDNR